jgi:hypothetical protein
VRRAGAALAIVTVVTAGAFAETLQFEAYQLQPGGGRKLLARGAREYSPDADVQVIDNRPSRHGNHWSKRLALFGKYELEADVYQEPQLDGFGLVIVERGNPNGFSWNWFDRERDDVFTKRQGPGRLKVSVVASNGLVELAAMEFLDDVVLRYLDDFVAKQPGESTHEIVIKKGSVFRVPRGRPTKS